jgi:hypothetical protein
MDYVTPFPSSSEDHLANDIDVLQARFGLNDGFRCEMGYFPIGN